MTDERTPLGGVRILDLSRLLPGPYATWVLGTMGAEVVKVESPGLGDYARNFPPMIGDVAALFHVINRGKQSIVIDLKRDEGRELLLRMLPQFDVLFEQFRPGVMEALGLGPEQLRARFPELIICSLTGYGQTGPLRRAAGHDLNYQALSGALWMQGRSGGPPPVPGVPTADLCGAMTAVSAILGALFQRERQGGGATLDVSMTDSIGAFAAPFVAAWCAEGEEAPGRGEALLSGGIAQYDVYETSCGGHLAVAALEPKFFARFAQAVGRPEWASAIPLPGPHQDALRRELSTLIRTKTRDEWVELLDGVDCCVSPVLDPGEAMDSQLFAQRGLRGAAQASGGEARWVECPLGAPIVGDAPQAGQHTDQVLSDLGLDAEEIAELRASGSIS